MSVDVKQTSDRQAGEFLVGGGEMDPLIHASD